MQGQTADTDLHLHKEQRRQPNMQKNKKRGHTVQNKPTAKVPVRQKTAAQ